MRVLNDIPMYPSNKRVSVKQVNELKLDEVTPLRGGVIVYTIRSGQLLFAFGVDRNSNEWTDFGGGISYIRRGETVLSGCMREFREETLGVFGEISQKDINSSVALYDDNMMILLLYLDVVPEIITSAFTERCNGSLDPEVVSIVWLTQEQLSTQINKRTSNFYERVRCFIHNATPFYDQLRC